MTVDLNMQSSYVEVYQGKDGHVRVAKVQVGKSQLTRPISKLRPLELQ